MTTLIIGADMAESAAARELASAGQPITQVAVHVSTGRHLFVDDFADSDAAGDTAPT